MEGVTWYTSAPQSVLPVSKVEAYLGEKNDGYWLRMKLMYEGESWLFVQSFKFLIDGRPLEIPVRGFKMERDNDRRVWEWADVAVNNEFYQILKAIANSKSAELRYVGKQYYKDRSIKEGEKKSIAKILKAFEDLGGTVN